MNDMLQRTESKYIEESNQGAQEKEPPSSEQRDMPFVHPYAAELAGYFHAFADKLMFYADGRYLGHHKHSLGTAALKTDIQMTKVRLEGLERLCKAWLQEFLSEAHKT